MISKIEKAGLSFVGKDETGRRMEVICSWKACLICGSELAWNSIWMVK